MEERKIIGYNLTETQYKETVLKLLVEGEQLGKELGFEMDLQKQGNIDKFNELGLLDKWFEPVYEKLFLTTMDGVKVYEGDEVWLFNFNGNLFSKKVGKGFNDVDSKVFSTKEAAENFILKEKWGLVTS